MSFCCSRFSHLVHCPCLDCKTAFVHLSGSSCYQTSATTSESGIYLLYGLSGGPLPSSCQSGSSVLYYSILRLGQGHVQSHFGAFLLFSYARDRQVQSTFPIQADITENMWESKTLLGERTRPGLYIEFCLCRCTWQLSMRGYRFLLLFCDCLFIKVMFANSCLLLP